LKGRHYEEARADEDVWQQITEKLIIRAFGDPSTNLSYFYSARAAGQHQMLPYGAGVPHALNQKNYEARVIRFEGVLHGCLEELKLDLPDTEVKGVYSLG
jgi:hypothetical protein